MPHIKLILGLFILSASIKAQLPTGEITGTVTDSAGGTIGGATIAITNTATNVQRSLITNGSGIYTAAALPLGNYSVRVNMVGWTCHHQDAHVRTHHGTFRPK